MGGKGVSGVVKLCCRSLKGWKEVEYEVVRDGNDNCITVRSYNRNVKSIQATEIASSYSIVHSVSQPF